MVEIEFDGAYAYIEGASTSLLNQLTQLLSYTDRSVEYLNKRNPWQYKDPVQSCFDRHRRRCLTGLLPRVMRFLKQEGIEFEIYRKHVVVAPTSRELPDWLYSHQVEALNYFLRYKRGIVQIPTGGGKTTIAAFAAHHFPDERILICVPKSNLMKDMQKRIEGVIGEEVGLYGDGKKIWRRVTVGIIDSLVKAAEADLPELKEVTVAILDEAHNTACDSNLLVAEKLTKADYVLGLSATAFRADGKDIVMEGVNGPKLLEVPEEELVNRGVIMRPTYLYIEYDDPKLVYKGAVSRSGAVIYPGATGKPEVESVYQRVVIENDERNQLTALIVQMWMENPNRKGSALVFVRNIEHGERLQQACASLDIELPFKSGQTCKGKQRDKLVEELRDGLHPIICCTEIFNEGADIPSLELIILAGAEGNERIHTQQTGRVLRTHKGKSRALIVDIADLEQFYLGQRAWKRRKYIRDRFGRECIRKVGIKELRDIIHATNRVAHH